MGAINRVVRYFSNLMIKLLTNKIPSARLLVSSQFPSILTVFKTQRNKKTMYQRKTFNFYLTKNTLTQKQVQYNFSFCITTFGRNKLERLPLFTFQASLIFASKALSLTSGLYCKNIMIVNDASRVVIMTIISDSTTCVNYAPRITNYTPGEPILNPYCLHCINITIINDTSRVIRMTS